MATEEEEDGVESIPTNGTDFLLSDLGESEGSAALKVDIVGERKCGQRCKR